MTIRLRFTLALTTLGSVLFAMYAIWAYSTEREELQDAAVVEMRLLGQSLTTAIENALRDQQGADVEETLGTLEVLAPNVDLHVRAANGTLLARSRGAISDATIEGLSTVAMAERVDRLGFDPPDDPERVYLAAPLILDDNRLVGTLVMVRPTDEMRADLERTRNRLVLALGLFSFGTLMAGLLLGTVLVTRPLAQILEGVRHVREGDFRTRVRSGRDDEIGELVGEFNSMIEALAVSRARAAEDADMRRRLEVGLQRVDKLVTVGQLSAGLAHEIGSPLQVLSGRASTLVDHPDPEVKRQAQVLVAQCDRITRVIEQLLSFGRRKQAVKGHCELVSPVRAVIDLLENEARRRQVELAFEVEGRDHAIVGDIDQLQQVALNIIRNALSATPPGGRITVRVARSGDSVQLRVADTGSGIDRETQARLFEPFFTTRATEGGTGLGLAVVRAIVDEHGGKIEVRSEPGAGAEFVVSFSHLKESHRG